MHQTSHRALCSLSQPQSLLNVSAQHAARSDVAALRDLLPGLQHNVAFKALLPKLEAALQPDAPPAAVQAAAAACQLAQEHASALADELPDAAVVAAAAAAALVRLLFYNLEKHPSCCPPEDYEPTRLLLSRMDKRLKAAARPYIMSVLERLFGARRRLGGRAGRARNAHGC